MARKLDFGKSGRLVPFANGGGYALATDDDRGSKQVNGAKGKITVNRVTSEFVTHPVEVPPANIA
jgi:hypothetical protein